MKISFTTMATPELDIAAQVNVAKEYGFDGVDLRVIEKGKGEISRDMSAADADVILRTTQGVILSSLLCYNEKIQSGYDSMVESLLEYMGLAACLHIPAIRIFTGKLDSAEDMNDLVQVLNTVLQKDISGTKIAMQNHVNCSVTLHQALDVCQKVNDPRIKMILSPDQAVAIGEEFESLLPQLAKHVSQLYVADLDKYNKHVLLGHGNIPYHRILNTLSENGFDGYVTLKWEKCWHPELPPYEKAFQAFLAWVNDVHSID